MPAYFVWMLYQVKWMHHLSRLQACQCLSNSRISDYKTGAKFLSPFVTLTFNPELTAAEQILNAVSSHNKEVGWPGSPNATPTKSRQEIIASLATMMYPLSIVLSLCLFTLLFIYISHSIGDLLSLSPGPRHIVAFWCFCRSECFIHISVRISWFRLDQIFLMPFSSLQGGPGAREPDRAPVTSGRTFLKEGRRRPADWKGYENHHIGQIFLTSDAWATNEICTKASMYTILSVRWSLLTSLNSGVQLDRGTSTWYYWLITLQNSCHSIKFHFSPGKFMIRVSIIYRKCRCQSVEERIHYGTAWSKLRLL